VIEAQPKAQLWGPDFELTPRFYVPGNTAFFVFGREDFFRRFVVTFDDQQGVLELDERE
jgi:hypothetical protein